MTKTELADLYRGYIACLNRQDWPDLGKFVDEDAVHNGRRLGLAGYVAMLERDFDDIPDLFFNVRMLVIDPPYVACRLGFDCSPKGKFLGLDVNGKCLSFSENVIYEFRGGKIVEVWSVIDKAAIEAQLADGR
ncbi:ester cyclase [Rhizobium sp. YTUHZ045]|uniref:ester cyclase n=1 Tax=unclassified Rhizobium TaxID=2613769 RepID=UPI003D33BBD2